MKRIIAFVLSVAMLFTLLPSLTMSTCAAERVEIYYNGNAQDSVTLPKGDYIELNAVKNVVGEAAYQWQIDVADNMWVDISGETGTNIRVSYAMIANILSGNAARIRCEMVCEGETINSDPVIVTVSEENSNVAAVIPEDDDVQILKPTPIPSTSEEESEEKSVGSEVSSGDNISSGDVPVVVENIPVVKTFSLRSASVNAVADETAEKVNIVINYVFTNGEVAAQPYTATVAKGSDFSAVVNNPDVVGYLPYVGENVESTSSVTLNYTDIQGDQTITVTYKPTLVNYKIVYKLQNIDGNGYTEDTNSGEIKQGLTDSIVPAVDKNFEGFSMLWYDTPAIAADGSTVVEVYYDRNFYLMLFELDGGYGVEPIYARYGSAVSVGTPTKPGYTFTSWSPAVPATMPMNGGTYTAQWSSATTAKVTVVVWGETADCSDEAKEYDYYGSGTLDASVGSSYTYGNEVLACATEAHTHTTQCRECGKEEHTHTVDAGCYELNCTVTTHDHETDGCTLQCTHEHNLGCILGCQHTHTDNCYTCGKNETTHVHSFENNCYKLICTKILHTHSSACNTCGKAEHTHTTDCTINIATRMPSNLWTRVQSETKIVASDGTTVVNVYYDRTEFTLTFKGSSNYGGTNTTYGTITDKWGADIEDRFFTICKEAYENSGTYSWSQKTSGNSPWTSYVGIMPQENRIYYAYDASGTMIAYYYFQTLDGEYNNEEGNVITVTAEGSGFTVTDEDRAEFEGFTHDRSISTSNGSSFNGAEFYYTRNSYVLDFNNGVDVVSSNTVKYQAPLSTFKDFVPNPPSTYEPGSVTFAGWYLNAECTGEEYKLENHTMPAANLILYAKWIPVTHEVKVYLTDEKTTQIGTTMEVPHGSFVPESSIPANPTNGNLKFVGWFYMDGNVEKAFDFNNMPVNKNLEIYAKWSDSTVVSYFVYYRAVDENGDVVLDANGNPLEIAEPTTGQALTGISRTFEAKASEDLLEGYQEGYFPETKSHTMVLEVGKDNTYIFYYVPAEAVPYKVYYKIVDENGNITGPAINADGKEYIKEVNDNRKAVVTENFIVVPGYMPDAYQKRLVVSADGEDNEITFYYVEDKEHAYYQLTHFTENINGGWTEYSSSQAIGNVGTTYNAQPLSINGFTYDEEKTEIVVGDNTTTGTSHSLTTEGLEIRHYYTRESCPYEVHYLEQGTEKELAAAKTKDENGNSLTGKYGEVVSEEAIVIPGYECITPSPSTLTIRIETDDIKNIIYFYYKEAEVDITYKVVGPAGVTDFGTVDLNDGTTTGAMAETSETVLAQSGVAVGATASASSKAYKFVGWYADESCTQQVSTDANYIPTKPSDGIWKEATYYAKFEYNFTSMTISKTVIGTSYDNNDIFIFDVKGSDGSEFSIYLKAGETKAITDVTVGVTYTVTERTNWSTRYTNTSSPGAKTLVADTTQNVFAFTNEIEESKWLSVTKMETNVFDKKN